MSACLQGVAYAMYVAGNNWLYNAMRLATLAVGGAAALQGTVTAEQLTTFCFYAEFMASALLSVCDQWGPISEVRCPARRAGVGAVWPMQQQQVLRAAAPFCVLRGAQPGPGCASPRQAGHWCVRASHGVPRRAACTTDVGRPASGGADGGSSSRDGSSWRCSSGGGRAWKWLTSSGG